MTLNSPIFAAAWLFLAPVILAQQPSRHAGDYTEALALAKASGHDIVVFQRGSDWNLLGESLYQKVWLNPGLLTALGEGFILVAVDRQEKVGAPALGSGADATMVPRFYQWTEPNTPLPENSIESVKTESGAIFQKGTDDTHVVHDPENALNPASDTLTLTLPAPKGARLLRLDFPPVPSLPNGGAGRASNGNFFINEVEVLAGDMPLKLTHAWASASEGGWGAAQTIDGIKDQTTNGWNPAAHLRQRRTMVFAMENPIDSDTTLRIILTCQSQWGQHVPGTIRATFVNEDAYSKAVVAIADAEILAAKNAAFTWWDGGVCPRVALLDSEGRAIAAENKPRGDLTPAMLAKIVKKMREKRQARDELLTKAAEAKGPEKAELLRQALDSLGFANWVGNDKCYEPIHTQIKEADPEDVSGSIRWLGFGLDPKSGVPWAKPTWQEALDTQGGKRVLTDADYQEALARVDKELADPRNKILSPENLQRIMVAKFHIYRQWKGHEEERFTVQQMIAEFDPTTFWGIGGAGYVGMHGKSATPYLTYGWKPSQVKAGRNEWTMTDTAYFFDHPGHYKILLRHTGGADKVRIKRLALVEGTEVLAEVSPDKDLGPGVDATLEVMLDLNAWQKDRDYTFVAELEAAEGHTDSHGAFSIEPWLEEPAPSTPVADYAALAKTLRQKIIPLCVENLDNLDALFTTEANRKDLALLELIRRCGEQTLTKISARPAGAAFLEALTSDIPWIESFLINDEAKWGQALENLRFLYANAQEQINNPLYRRVATAMSLSAGDLNRYRFLDRFQAIIRTHQEGLLHHSFDALDTREMRWAVYLQGTAVDFDFLVNETQVRLGDYLGSCWGIPYIDPNVYGYSVQGWGYVDPWTHHYGTGTGDRPYRVQRQVGGVCGTLSGYGAAVSKVHGIMSTTVGQPGHCAYVVRIGDEWPTGNDVSGPETNGASVFEGTGFPTMHRLYEVIHADKSARTKAAHLAWTAQLLRDQHRASVRLLPGLKYHVYQLPGGNLAEIPNRQPIQSGGADEFNLAAVLPLDTTNFGVVWEGTMEITGDGPVQVQLQSDDGAVLQIGDQKIACNQAPFLLPLKPGQYPIRLEYGQAGGAYSLTVNWITPSLWKDDWSRAFGQALTAHPIDYAHWLETIKAMENTSDTSADAWKKMIHTLAKNFNRFHEAGWALINRCYAKIAPDMTPAERMELLLACHAQLKQANAPKYMGYNLTAVLNTHADSLGEPTVALEFFGKLLAVHHNEDVTQNRVFGDVMNWGNTRFASNPLTSATYAKTIESFFAAQGDGADSNLMRQQITAGIRKTSEAGDLASYRLWTGMAAQFLPPVQAGEIHLSPAQMAEPPKFEPFPGELLGKTALLKTSSACQHDRPLSYTAILDGSAPGYFDTNNEEKPWAQISLAGESEIFGIVLLNRYELPPNHPEVSWAAPLKVLASVDGTNWTEVATHATPDMVIRIDLTGKVERARQRLGSGDGERKTLLTRQIAFEPLPASVLFALGRQGQHSKYEKYGFPGLRDGNQLNAIDGGSGKPGIGSARRQNRETVALEIGKKHIISLVIVSSAQGERSEGNIASTERNG
jgi:hypothetical protein